MDKKSSFKELYTAPIEASTHDDLKFQRDRLFTLTNGFNNNFERTEYRKAVKALITANDTIEAITKGESIGVVRYTWNAFKNFIIEPGFK